MAIVSLFEWFIFKSCLSKDDEETSSKISGILNRNYYTIAHDLNPGENKENQKAQNAAEDTTENGKTDETLHEKTDNVTEEEEEEDDVDEAEHLEKGGGKLIITVENPEKTQVCDNRTFTWVSL